MDLGYIAAFFELVISGINSGLGTSIPNDWAEPFAVVLLLPLLLFALFASINKARVQVKRWNGNRDALDADGHAVVETIKGDLDKLKPEIQKAANNNKVEELQPILNLLFERIDNAETLVDNSSEEETTEQKLDRNGRMPRRQMVRLVRETVLSNLWAGNYFDETLKHRHVFRASFEDHDRKRISITVRTPFAKLPKEKDDPYQIDVREENRYVLRMHWDPFEHAKITVWYCERGNWEDAILSWNVTHEYVPKIPDEPTEAQRYASALG